MAAHLFVSPRRLNAPRRIRGVAFASLVGGLVSLACSDDDPRPPGSSSPGTGGATGGAAGHAGGGAPSGGASAAGGSSGGDPSGGAAGAAGAPMGTCGNGVAEAGEACDGEDVAHTCADYGFDEGTLACTARCSADTSGCSGSERCFDNRDNDGDKQLDCVDEDCAAACAAACVDPPLLADSTTVAGNTFGHAAETDPSCASGATGSEVEYRFTAEQTGMLELELQTGADLLLSVRPSCGDPSGELGCTRGGRLRVPIQADDQVVIVVDGAEPDASGVYQLSARSRPIACGDGIRDVGEGCDDGNEASGDGCSSGCAVESSEAEPNDTLDAANAVASPFFGEISDGDTDVIAVTAAEPLTSLTAEIADFGDGACASGELDSFVEILDDGGGVLSEDDDGAEGLCSLAAVSSDGPLPAGVYYVRVTAAPTGFTASFPYVLRISAE